MQSNSFSPNDPATLAILLRSIGPERTASYAVASGGGDERTVRLYVWNAGLGGAFLPALGMVEVALRNALHESLRGHFTNPWYDDQRFISLDPERFEPSIKRAKRYIANGGKEITGPRMIAQLTFGFWVLLLSPTYARTLWPVLRPAFKVRVPRRRIAGVLNPLVAFRNRVAHHEVIHNRDPRGMYDHVLQAATYLSPGLENWVEHLSRIEFFLDQAPYSAPYTF